MTAESVRHLLVGCLPALYILALFYLRRRPLSLGQFTARGLFALLVPALGPFLTILSGPGEPPHRTRPRRIRRYS